MKAAVASYLVGESSVRVALVEENLAYNTLVDTVVLLGVCVARWEMVNARKEFGKGIRVKEEGGEKS